MSEFHDVQEAAPQERVPDEEKAAEEDWEDWWNTDRVDAVGWAALFLWGALVVLATYTSFQEDFSW